MNPCVFCKIHLKEIPSKVIAENEIAFVIEDLYPQAKKHYLIIPKKHYRGLVELSRSSECDQTITEMTKLALSVAKTQGFEGFRTVINTEALGGQSVFHLHMHLLGGEQLKGSFGA
jgi:histidine triad (HIT) family protein